MLGSWDDDEILHHFVDGQNPIVIPWNLQCFIVTNSYLAWCRISQPSTVAIENSHRNSEFSIVFPWKMVIFHSYVNVYRRVITVEPRFTTKNGCLVGGFNLPLWKMMELVSWDYDSQYMEKQQMFQTTNQLCNEDMSWGISRYIIRFSIIISPKLELWMDNNSRIFFWNQWDITKNMIYKYLA